MTVLDTLAFKEKYEHSKTLKFLKIYLMLFEGPCHAF